MEWTVYPHSLELLWCKTQTSAAPQGEASRPSHAPVHPQPCSSLGFSHPFMKWGSDYIRAFQTSHPSKLQSVEGSFTECGDPVLSSPLPKVARNHYRLKLTATNSGCPSRPIATNGPLTGKASHTAEERAEVKQGHEVVGGGRLHWGLGVWCGGF